MNAKFLENLIIYREGNQLDFCKMILSQKIKCQFVVINKKSLAKIYIDELVKSDSVQVILLIEARAAKYYWKKFRDTIYKKINWVGRNPHSQDPANKILDIGYHFLTHRIISMCEELDLNTELGFFHKAQSSRSHPFVYDFIEWLRPFVVDRVFLNILGKKKKKLETVDQKLISYFIFKIKKEFSRTYYHKKLKYCINLEYWIKLLLLEFIGCINNKKEYAPLFPTLRHETRCKTKPPQPRLKR